MTERSEGTASPPANTPGRPVIIAPSTWTTPSATVSPDTESISAEARSLRHPSLVIDLRAANERTRSADELERQAAQLREFLGLA